MEHERNRPEDEREKLKDEELDKVSGGRGGVNPEFGVHQEGRGVEPEGGRHPGHVEPEHRSL